MHASVRRGDGVYVKSAGVMGCMCQCVSECVCGFGT